MGTLTYREQLLHPNWQRRRLEMLESAGWQCTNCGSDEKTLHVHHRQYFKGRMLWEYEDVELAVLCDPCHADEHVDLEVLKQILAIANAGSAAALLAGFHKPDDWFDRGLIESGRQTEPLAFAAGFVAYLTYSLCDIDDMRKVAAFAAGLARPNAESKLVFEHSRGNTFGEDMG